MKFPLTSIHQIEMTSRCNLRCRYCVHPKMARAKIDMDEATFVRSLMWVSTFVRRGTQGELNLAGIGESTMHPEFVRYVHLAREALGWGRALVLATNGLLMTDELAQAIAPSKIMVWVSLHRPEKAGPAVEALRRAGILAGVSADPSISAIDWAGQVQWHVSVPERRQCPWVKGGWCVVLADGRVSRCCFDGSGIGVLGTVHDDLPSVETSPYALCRTCDQDVGVPFPVAEQPKEEEPHADPQGFRWLPDAASHEPA